MPFRCPHCNAPAGLEIADTIELAPDALWDEITLQVLDCSACGFSALGVYTEGRRGALDAETWEHNGFLAKPSDVQHVRQAIHACPRPHEALCRCEVHKTLAQTAADPAGHLFRLRMA